LTIAEDLATRFSQLPVVEAVAVAGSLAAGTADSSSDTESEIPSGQRLAIAREYSADARTNDFWGPGNEWLDPNTGIHVDVMFWTVGWIEDQMDRILRRHEAWVGYTTSFWHTVKNALILFDRHDWFHRLVATAQQAYPEPLVANIIAQNYPILRQNESAYLHQLEKAVARGDLVSVNHRIAALLASYFDILFAVNRLPHPGETRLLETAAATCTTLPTNMNKEMTALLQAGGRGGSEVIDRVQTLLDGLDTWLQAEGIDI
jgi:hypothetical protein